MSISKGVLAWLETCPGVNTVEEFDINQVEDDEVGIYKQPSNVVEKLMDGSELRKEYYYFLFARDVQVKSDRETNEQLLENVESWISLQEYTENYPEIGYKVHEIGMSNGFYMMERDEDSATYQIAIEIQYERGVL